MAVAVGIRVNGRGNGGVMVNTTNDKKVGYKPISLRMEWLRLIDVDWLWLMKVIGYAMGIA